jgi:hypothetical protein
MAIFDRTFAPKVQLELIRRKLKITGVQNVMVPHVRVTSLVEGTLYGRQLHGFTLGNVDIKKTPTIDDYFNTKGQGTAVGLTYNGPNDTAEKVVLDTGNKKLPPPGVTNVSISTQSTGGFIFKATVSLKFYGKEQYDFIYQTMLRPGNPIFVEYGHTHMKESEKDLGFFQELNGTLIESLKQNLRDNRPFKASTNSGRVLGLVSNFRVRLNEQNEYEAEIELINSLEFLFTISPEDTFLDYGPLSGDQQGGLKYLSKSIRSNFGWEKGEDYDPKMDNIFKKVLDDALTRPEEEFIGDEQSNVLVEENPDWRKYIIIPYGIGGTTGAKDGSGDWDMSTDESEKRSSDAMENSGNVYISLSYFFKKLLNDILEISYYDREHAGQANMAADAMGNHNFTQIEIDRARPEIEQEMDNLSEYDKIWSRENWSAMEGYDDDEEINAAGVELPYSGGRKVMTQHEIQRRYNELEALLDDPESQSSKITESAELGESATSTEVSLTTNRDFVGYWPMLRSVNVKNVIINNLNIYNDYSDKTTAAEEGEMKSGSTIVEEPTKRKKHNGIDYAWPGCSGAPVGACADGTVVDFRKSDSFGNVVEILHDDGFYSLYAHLERFAGNMRVHLPVKTGDVIGYVGNTGRSTGAHLHFELSKGGKPIYKGGKGIDPLKPAVGPSGYQPPFGKTNVTSRYGLRDSPFPAAPVAAHHDDSRRPPNPDLLHHPRAPISGYFYRQRGIQDYTDKYQDDEIINLFKYVPWWAPDHVSRSGTGTVGKVAYQPQWTSGNYQSKRTNFNGIFVNYEKVRSAFIGSKSVGEAIQKILNMVNTASNGILQLRMRYMDHVDMSNVSGTREIVRVNKIKIYDENVLPSKKEVEEKVQPYRFFEDNVSEAMSYNFDFSLPGSVAATVMANTFQADEMSAAGGDPQRKALISYGYALDSNLNPALTSLVNINNSGQESANSPVKAKLTEKELAEEDEKQRSTEDVEKDEFYRALLGYRELDPPKQKASVHRAGLYNVIPSAGKINIRLQGLDGWRFGDMFTVHNVLPRPYDGNNVFMVTGYKHDINSQGWFTEVDGTMIASIPDNIKEIQTALFASDNEAGGGSADEQEEQARLQQYRERSGVTSTTAVTGEGEGVLTAWGWYAYQEDDVVERIPTDRNGVSGTLINVYSASGDHIVGPVFRPNT